MEPTIIHLETRDTSYVLRVNHFSHLENLYYGSKIKVSDDMFPLEYKQKNTLGTTTIYDEGIDPTYSLDHVNLELSTYGKGDYRPASLIVESDLGFVSDFKVVEFRHKVDFDFSKEDLPAPHGANECFEIDLRDEYSALLVTLRYLVFKDSNVIARSVIVHKQKRKHPHLNRIMSLNLDLYNKNFEALGLYGTWANEAHLTAHKLTPGTFKLSTIAGPSSNRHNPFLILKTPEASLDYGEYYGVNLMYSGPFELSVNLASNNRVRVQAGLNDETFAYDLGNGDFYAPWAALTYSNKGQNGLSANYHRFVNDHVVRQAFSRQTRPILLNNWEATYFNFDEAKLLKLMKSAKDLGIEMLVLDDGWFIERDNDYTGLGNYEVNKKKLPHGLDGLAKKANKQGLKFGLWFEPEMVSETSKVYLDHPDWIVNVPNFKASKGRHQYCFDLSLVEVQNYIIDNVTAVLSSANIEYVKWDYNRNISDFYSKSGNHSTFFYDYTKGLYKILKTLTERFPHILWEGCASGGNRFDLGVLSYFDQIWASDCSDAYERVRILKNLALVYPLSVISAHVSDVPNHQTLREIALNTRFNVSLFSGGFGYELDITTLEPLEEKQVKAQIEYYKEHRDIVVNGTYYELPNETSFERYGFAVVSRGKERAVVSLVNGIATTMPVSESLPRLDVNEHQTYHVCGFNQVSNLHKFGGLLKMVLPTFIKADGLIVNRLAKSKSAEQLIDVEVKEDYLVDGSLLKAGALRLYPQWSGTGVNEQTRVLGDFGSIIYSIYTEN
ncbi:MAG TPA: alpha-galactosidase [Bacilli bacterium]|nr:alpha-galactosidase [Bacilli bacterium]